MAVVIRRTLHFNADRTIVERVVLDDVAITAVDAQAHVLRGNGVVQRAPALVVADGRIPDVEEFQVVGVVVAVAHRANDGRNAAERGVVGVQVEVVVQESKVDSCQLAVVVQRHALNLRIVHVDVDLTVVAWVDAREVV